MNQYEILFLKDLYLFIFIVLIILIFISIVKDNNNIKFVFGLLICLFIVPFLGFRDLNVGVDTLNYRDIYDTMPNSLSLIEFRDPIWDFVTFFFSNNRIDISYYFLLSSFIYVYFAYSGAKSILQQNALYFLVLFLVVPNFALYGTNTIRTGIAASIFLYSFKWKNKKIKQALIFILSLFIHFSVIVPLLFYYLSARLKTIKISMSIWFLFLILATLGISLGDVMPFEMERLSQYTSVKDNDVTTKVLNFIIYSISPILLGVYTIYIKKKSDVLYIRLLNTYIFSNCIYVLTFNIMFSERFAYLSEFLMPLLLVYPIIKFKLFKNPQLKLASIFLIIFLIKAYKIIII